jgi:hypothetical protein
MKSKYDYDIIRDYLHGLTDRQTSQRIRELIRTDDIARNIAAGILQLEHDFHGDENQVESYIDGLLQKQLRLIESEPKSRLIRIGWMKMAAALLILVLSGFVLWFTVLKNENVLDEELSEPYPLMVTRGPEMNAGFERYLARDYENAISMFEADSADVTARFYNALSNLYAQHYDRSITLLSSLKESRYRDQALWYQALALMKLGKKGEAERILKTIADDPAHYKSPEARKLLPPSND